MNGVSVRPPTRAERRNKVHMLEHRSDGEYTACTCTNGREGEYWVTEDWSRVTCKRCLKYAP